MTRLARRTVLAASVAALVAPMAACRQDTPASSAPPGTAPPIADAEAELAKLETRFAGRIGVYAVDTGTGTTIAHRSGERFPMCSTFKMLAAAAILRSRQAEPGLLDRVVRYDAAKVVSVSPVTEQHVADGMTISALCEAAVTRSDNNAANLLLEQLGGPHAITGFARALGDPVTRLDRWEPELNVVPPGEVRDTTSPERMAANLRALVLGDALDPAGRDLLTGWLVANKTGDTRIRAGLPRSWRVGDKTGGGARGESSDIAVTWPPERDPLVITVYTVPDDPSRDADHAVLAAAASTVADALVA
jgi:beta-lactamase class A